MKFLKHFSVVALVIVVTSAMANPSHPTVTQGSATFSSQGANLTVTTSDRAYINWSTFNIGAGEMTTFAQPSSTSVVWNHINDSNPSQILGNLDANGLIVLQNQNGFFVGGNAAIHASGIVMTTATTPQLDLSGGSAWEFTAPPPEAKIINYGRIDVGSGGSAYLIAHDIDNHGSINAPQGNIGLFANREVLLSSRPDGRGLSAQVSLPAGSIDNSGNLVADAGTIALHAEVVNQGGLIQANSVREQNGVIEILASDAVNLTSSSIIKANGDNGISAGGNVTLHGGKTFSDQSGSSISVASGTLGGAGGTVEISAPSMASINSTIDGHAAPGFTGGKLLIDPTDIKIGNTGSDSAGTGTVGVGDPPATLNLNVNTAFLGFSQIDLQASRDITLLDGTTWDLAASTGISGPGCQLTLEAGRNINLGTRTGANIYAGNGWSLTLEAGRDFGTMSDVIAGTGIIKLFGSGTIQAQNGSIDILAGDSISVGTGAVRTMNGGSIDATAVSGDINTGQNANGYTFGSSGYSVSAGLGGISTAAGGDVTLTAGGDITSYLPSGTSKNPTDAGSGAFGAQPGVVTVTAGGDISGHFVAADSEKNGQLVASTITSLNGNAGTSDNLLALSLVKGGWQVNAPNGSISLQEVRNPNGALNGKTGVGGRGPFWHYFDYDPLSFVDLEAGDGVNLEGSLLPRYTGDQIGVIYPPSLTINARAGGVTLGNDLILFPSSVGELNVRTTGGGWLEGAGHSLTMSDSDQTQWNGGTDFLLDHAPHPIQLNNPNPVVFDISGTVDNIIINTPKATQMNVGGDMKNTSFSGQNLHAGDATSINVAGSIIEQNVYSFVTLSGAGLPLPPKRFPGDRTTDYLLYLKDAVVAGSGPSSADAGQLFPTLNLFYNADTHQLGYYGVMNLTTLQLLSGPLQVKTYLPNGKPVLDASGNYVTKTVNFAADPAMLQALYVASQSAIDPKDAPLGFQLGGPGQFNINASSIDLGASGGINSIGPFANHSLASLPGGGADLNINVQNDLDMFASQISSYYKGGINIVVGGSIDAGVQNLPFSQPLSPHGIWTAGTGANVSVIAGGDIHVSGSRIAAFNGGNVFVESLHGNVDAGNGGSSEVLVDQVVVDPHTYTVAVSQQRIAGSGIFASTFPDAPSSLRVGDITVLTPQGNVDANAGGISQMPENGNKSLLPTLTITAGSYNPDGTVAYEGNIEAANSGIIGVNIKLKATGKVNALVVGTGAVDIKADKSITGPAIIGVGPVGIDGPTITVVVAISGGKMNLVGQFQGEALSQSVTGAQSSLESSASSVTGSSSAAAQETSTTAQQTEDPSNATTTDDNKKKKENRPLLAKYVGRVTVLLPRSKK